MGLKMMGVIFLALSGVFYTAERIAKRLASGLVDAGYAASGMSTFGVGSYPSFFDNFFVWFFFLVGGLMIMNSFLISVWKNYNATK